MSNSSSDMLQTRHEQRGLIKHFIALSPFVAGEKKIMFLLGILSIQNVINGLDFPLYFHDKHLCAFHTCTHLINKTVFIA